MLTHEKKREHQKELRKIESRAKRLIYQMHRLEEEWKKAHSQLDEDARSEFPNTLGDTLAKWNRIDDIEISL